MLGDDKFNDLPVLLPKAPYEMEVVIMRRFIRVFALLSICCLFISSANLAQAEEKKKELKEQMKLKLSHSQEVLEGMVREDFAKIEKGANGLVVICQTLGWTEEKTKGQFKTHDTEFHNIAHELMNLAKEGNLEGVYYKYIQMTVSCIDCHQHIRDVEAPEKYRGGIHEGEFLYKGRHVHSR